jgi:putative redox protein
MATITADLVDGYEVEIRSAQHVWRADEPPESGGTGTGPSPYELLLGALGACTCMTVSMYARRKDIALDAVSVRYTFDRVHASDCEDCVEGAEGYLDRVTAEVFVDGTFTEEQRTRLQEVALRCPVHRTLERGIHFSERVVVG